MPEEVNTPDQIKNYLLNAEAVKSKLLLNHFYSIDNIISFVNSIGIEGYRIVSIYQNDNGDILLRLNNEYTKDPKTAYQFASYIMNLYYTYNLEILKKILNPIELNALFDLRISHLLYTIDTFRDRTYNMYFSIKL